MTLLPEVEDALRDAIRRDQRAHPSVGSQRRVGARLEMVGGRLAIGLSVFVALAIGAVALIASGNRHGSTPPVSPAIGTLASSRQELINTLTIMRRPQTRGDLNPRFLFGPFRAEQFLLNHHRPLPAGLKHPFALNGGAELDRALLRVMALPGGRGFLAFTPVSYQPSRRSSRRAEGLDLEFAFRLVGNSLDLNGGFGQLPTSVAEFEQHGMTIGALTRRGRVATGILVVPDGVTRVTLRSVQSVQVGEGEGGIRIRTSPGAFGTDSVAVHDNIATYGFRIPTVQDGRLVSGKDGVNATAEATWFDAAGRVIRHTTTGIGLVVNIHGRRRLPPLSRNSKAFLKSRFCAENPRACTTSTTGTGTTSSGANSTTTGTGTSATQTGTTASH
jgi:hypothetical protein